MGIKGSVKRGQDGHFIHANCDTDIIVAEEPPLGSTAKPEELYQVIERFCNGRRCVLDQETCRSGYLLISVGMKPGKTFALALMHHPCRRLELFGEEHNIRPGWVTVGRSLHTSNFSPTVYSSNFKNPDGSPYIENRLSSGKVPFGAPNLLPQDDAIEDLRPKSPPHGRK